MQLPELSLLAIFFTGLLGGVHCAGMCGGIVSALGMLRHKPMATATGRAVNVPVTVVSNPGMSTRVGATAGAARVMNTVSHGVGAGARFGFQSTLAAVSLYNIGRVSTYALLGALAGGIGSTAWLMQSLLPVQQTAFLISNLLLILMGLYIIGVRRIGAALESMGTVIWKRIKPFATQRLSGSGPLNSLLAGSVWGLVPCGLVYAVLGAALVSGSARQGALLMLVFGLGTLPNLMAIGLAGQWLARASRNRKVRLGAGLLIIGFGCMGLMHWSMMTSGSHDMQSDLHDRSQGFALEPFESTYLTSVRS